MLTPIEFIRQLRVIFREKDPKYRAKNNLFELCQIKGILEYITIFSVLRV